MRLTTVILIASLMQVSASGLAQKISISKSKAPLKEVIDELRKISGYNFIATDEVFDRSKLVTIQVRNAEMTAVLEQIFKDQLITYVLNDRMVILKVKKSASNNPIAQFQDIVVKGVVKDESGAGIPGTTVVVKEAKGIGVSTDGEGKFTLKVPDNATLVFSAVGFETVEVPATASMSVVLKASNNKLDDVLIRAYGTTTKRKTTNAISTLDMKNVASLPVQSVNDAVAGRIPGVIVTASSGEPGAKSSITVRGQSPIYVIDNIVRSSNDFSNLNPNDIESYSILKDAAATALYGNKGANGVVLVTTKRGKEGVTSINYAYNQIFSQPTIFPKQVGSYDQLSAINRIYKDEGKDLPNSEADLEKYRTGSDPWLFPNTNWQDLTMKKFAPEMRHDLALTSGTKKLSYYAGVSYYDQGGIFRTDKNYNKRTTYRLNTTSEFEKINLKVTAGLDGFIESNMVPVEGYSYVLMAIRNRSARQLGRNEFGLPTAIPENPLRALDPSAGYQKRFAKILNTNLGLEYAAHFLEGLKFKVNATYTTYNNGDKSWYVFAPGYLIGSTTPVYGTAPNLSVGQGQGTTTTLQGYVLYNKKFGDHSIDFTGIYEQQKDEQSNVFGNKKNYQVMYDQLIAGPALDQSVAGAESEAGSVGFLGRLGYSYKSKYTVEGSIRRDGDYLFVPGRQWGTFYAVSGNYVISEEQFMNTLRDKHILDFLKIRGSFGVLGDKTGVSPFQYVSSYSINPTAYVINNEVVQGTSEPGSLPSTQYSWQTIRNRNFGLEFASLNNRLNGTVDYYYTRRTGFVIGDPRFSQTLGIGLPRINFAEGAVRTEGYDFNLNWTSNIQDFTYQIGVNFTRYNSLEERSALDDDATLKNPYTRRTNIEGNFLQTGYLNDGFYTANSQLLTGAHSRGAYNLVAGDLRYQDVNGDGQITDDDLRRIGNNSFPRTNYGITLDLGYNGFSFNAVIQGAGNRDRYLGGGVQGGNEQVYAFQQNYWRVDNPDALFPRAVSGVAENGYNNYYASDFWLVKSKYIRLKYVQFSYDFKKGVLKKSPFQQLKLFVSGTNLLTSANSQKYFIDPEANTNNESYPIQRTFAFGLNVGF